MLCTHLHNAIDVTTWLLYYATGGMDYYVFYCKRQKFAFALELFILILYLVNVKLHSFLIFVVCIASVSFLIENKV